MIVAYLPRFATMSFLIGFVEPLDVDSNERCWLVDLTYLTALENLLFTVYILLYIFLYACFLFILFNPLN